MKRVSLAILLIGAGIGSASAANDLIWVFDHDESWRKPGHPDVAKETMDELLR